MRKWKKVSLLMILTVLLLSAVNGCTKEQQYSQDTAAVVNGKTISEKDIEQELKEREIIIKISGKLQALEPGRLTDKENILNSLGVFEKDLTSEQKRYIESIDRSTTKTLTANEAFNLLLRKEVYYQEAVKQGYQVSIERADQILKEGDGETEKNLKDDPKAWQTYQKMTTSVKEVLQEYGFQSQEDYLQQRLEKSAQAMRINLMKNEFNEITAAKLPQANGFQMEIAKSNAWDDYGEYLLKKAKVKILNENYTFEYYGDPWSFGTLDLKAA